LNPENGMIGLQTLTLSETYDKPLNHLPASVKIVRLKY